MSQDRQNASDLGSVGLGESLAPPHSGQRGPSGEPDVNHGEVVPVRVVPLTGWRSVVYKQGRKLKLELRFNSRSDNDWKLLETIQSEALVINSSINAAAAEKQRLEDERSERRAMIVDFRNQRPRSMTIFVANQAGDGSKTTTCAYLALTFRDCLKALPVIIVECRRDSAQGVDKLALDHAKVVTIREFYRRYKTGELSDEHGALRNELIMDALQQSDSGIYYLQADLDTPLNDTFNIQAAADVIKVLKSTGAIIIIDTGNNPTDPITIGMANESAVGVFPTQPKAKSLTLRRRTLEAIKTHVRSPILEDSISVLSALEPQHSVDQLMDLLGPYTEPDRLFTTEFDQYMKDDAVVVQDSDGIRATDNGTKVADLNRISQFNRDAFEKMACELLSIFVHQVSGDARNDLSNIKTVRQLREASGQTQTTNHHTD